jgi:hypothetical protein
MSAAASATAVNVFNGVSPLGLLAEHRLGLLF